MEHWLELLLERKLISKEGFGEIKNYGNELQVKLNLFIKATLKAKDQQK